MLILLPPSETKRSGGRGAPLRLDGLALPCLTAERRSVLDAMIALSEDADTAARVLRLGPSQRDEIAVNAALLASPTMPAMDRYTGVLFDALDAASLDGAARRWLGRHVMIHSVPFGPVGALDAIPRYRLGAAASLPGLPPLRRVWSDAVTAALAERASPFALDLRSEAYVGLGPIADGVPSAYVRVVAEGPAGTVRALNHFNKHAKGALVRALAESRPRLASVAAFRRWAESAGIVLVDGAGAGELMLVV